MVATYQRIQLKRNPKPSLLTLPETVKLYHPNCEVGSEDDIIEVVCPIQDGEYDDLFNKGDDIVKFGCNKMFEGHKAEYCEHELSKTEMARIWRFDSKSRVEYRVLPKFSKKNSEL